MSDKSLVRRTQHRIVHSNSVSGAAGRGMVLAGGGGLALMGVAAVLPFISMFWLCMIILGVGVIVME